MSDHNQTPSPSPATPSAASSTVAPGAARPPLLLKLDAAAAELQCTRRSLERQIAAGRITAVHIGRSVRIERRELEAFIGLLRAEAQSETRLKASASNGLSWADSHPQRGEVHGSTA